MAPSVGLMQVRLLNPANFATRATVVESRNDENTMHFSCQATAYLPAIHPSNGEPPLRKDERIDPCRNIVYRLLFDWPVISLINSQWLRFYRTEIAIGYRKSQDMEMNSNLPVTTSHHHPLSTFFTQSSTTYRSSIHGSILAFVVVADIPFWAPVLFWLYLSPGCFYPCQKMLVRWGHHIICRQDRT